MITHSDEQLRGNAHGLRRCRYHGMAKTHVQHVLTAAGTNIIRLSLHPPTERNPRPPSHFHRLCQTPSTGAAA
jgi:Transposase DDE domain